MVRQKKQKKDKTVVDDLARLRREQAEKILEVVKEAWSPEGESKDAE